MTTLAAIGLWAALLTEVTFASLGIGLPAIPGTLRAMRRLENTVRRRTGDWCGVAIRVPYLPSRERHAYRFVLVSVLRGQRPITTDGALIAAACSACPGPTT